MTKIIGYSYVPQVYRNPRTHQFTQTYIPLIPIKISSNQRQISPQFDALLDSGSDRNLFPMSLANHIGIVFKGVNPNKVYGIGKGQIDAYPAKIIIWLGAKQYGTEADFSPQQNIPILGRYGFFNLFKSIKFDEKGQFVYIEE